MKHFILTVVLGTLPLTATQAQSYRQSRYYNPQTGRLDYRQPYRPGYWHDGTTYYGFRLGPAFTTVNSDDKYLDGSSMKTGLSVEPFLGGYLACGVSGKIKDFGIREAYNSFSSSPYSFERFDGGLRLGCGISYDLLYADIGYDIGLANISHDDFDTSHNGALMLTVGVNF